jgi:hypothetical protein
MTDSTRQKIASPWARLGAELPSELDGRKVLLVGPSIGAEELGRTASKAEYWDPAGAAKLPTGPFEFVVCAETIQSDPHPANLLTDLCAVTATGATLLLHARVLTDPEQSAYARFVGAAAGTGGDEWVAGRLALRWTVETNGFDVERWIDAGSSEPRGEDDAYLVAIRTERTPALILATPDPVDRPSQTGGGS